MEEREGEGVGDGGGEGRRGCRGGLMGARCEDGEKGLGEGGKEGRGERIGNEGGKG